MVGVIARLVQTSPDRVQKMFRGFNHSAMPDESTTDLGWAGGDGLSPAANYTPEVSWHFKRAKVSGRGTPD